MRAGMVLGAALWCGIVAAVYACDRTEPLRAPTITVTTPLTRDSVVAQEARRAHVPPGLAVAVSHVEDLTGDSLALSERGAVGIMQVLPTYWLKAFPGECYGARSLFDRSRNACVGVHVLALYKEKYGSWQTALCAYHGSLAMPATCRAYVESVLEAA